ncbi:MAG: CDGSH iron-sulfur domain-containing protein, partial [Candidatus Bipolaricaulia bacterium]
MRSRIYSFEADGIVVHWDYHRCIHVEACVRALPDVFDRHKRPWITPACGSVNDVAAACEACPTGALHYERRDTGSPEATPKMNEITVSSDGPLYVKGDVRVTDADGETILKDTRVALCRCGLSRNKPLCDGSHEKAAFKSAGALTEAQVKNATDVPDGGKLVIRTVDPGPLTIKGSAAIRGEGASYC